MTRQEIHRRGFLGSLIAIATVAVIPVVWVVRKYCVINVRDYGAVGDGVSDDRVAVFAAIQVVESAGGGTVYFPPGVYNLDPVEK